MTGLCPDVNRAAHPGPIPGLPKLVSEEKSRSWGLMSVGVFRRAPGEMVWSSDYHRISYVLTDICARSKATMGPSRNIACSAVTSRCGPAAGLCDQSHLTSIFRRETGETPGRYRAALA